MDKLNNEDAVRMIGRKLRKGAKNYDRKHRRRNPNDFSVELIWFHMLIFLVVITPLVVIVSTTYFEIKNLKFTKEQIKQDAINVTMASVRVEDAQIKVVNASMKLYNAVEDGCRSTPGEVLLFTFREIFPEEKDFVDNISDGLISIYALLDNHPELYEQPGVLRAMQDVEVARIGINSSIDIYNSNVEFYDFWVDQWNSSSFCKVFGGGEVKPHKFSRISLKK